MVRCVVASWRRRCRFCALTTFVPPLFWLVSRSSPLPRRVLDHAVVGNFVLVMIVWSWFDWVRISPESNRNFCVDLSDYGNAKPGTPVELWGRWDGQNQLWRLQGI